MTYFAILTILITIATASGITVIAHMFKERMLMKLFICLYLILMMHWIDTGLTLAQTNITCSVKEKS